MPIEPMPIDQRRIEAAVTELLAAIGDDPARPGLVDTPRRVGEAYAEFFAGLGVDPVAVLRAGAVEEAPEHPGPVVLRDVAFRSICEHHLLPFTGVAHLAYQPRTRVAGLGRLVAALEALAARPQLQERLTEQVADALLEGLEADGVLVVLDARHQCVAARGPRQADSTTVTVAARGTLADPAARSATLSLIWGKVVS